TLTAITDDKFGNLLAVAQAQHGGPITLAPGASFSFTFSATLTLHGGEGHTNVVTVTGTDDEGSTATASDDHLVKGVAVAPSITVAKTGPLTVPEGGSPVTYSFTVTYPSDTPPPVTLTAIADNKFGDLLAVAQAQHGGPITLAPGASFSFTFSATLTLDG